MTVYKFTEEQLLAIIEDAVDIYRHEVIVKNGENVRRPPVFADHYVKHLTSVWYGDGKSEEEDGR